MGHCFISASKKCYIFYKIVDIFQTFLIFFPTKKWEITLLNYFHEYSILLHPNFCVLSVDLVSPLSVKRSGGRAGGRRKHHFREMRQPLHLPCQPTIAAQLLENGGKIEPYTIIIMPDLKKVIRQSNHP
jgi:hypothetical protein